MKFSRYLKDKKISIISLLVFLIFIALLMNAFKTNIACIISVVVLALFFFMINLLYDYVKRRKFYNDFLLQLDNLDRKILITETLPEADFYEAKIITDALYEINLEVHNEINALQMAVSDFKEYVEMWIHEVKLPLASLMLMNHNKNADLILQKQKLDDLEKYLDQILYYVRADVSDKDYLLKKVSLDDMINNVIKNNKEALIFNHISIHKSDIKETVITDEKWLEFIVGQVVNNSIKYIKENPEIKFYTETKEDIVRFVIEDNGIGISTNDLSRVFDKSFTGENGRTGRNSTGMGLFICKKLCTKLGHTIEIESEKNKFTRVILCFGKNEFYTDVI